MKGFTTPGGVHFERDPRDLGDYRAEVGGIKFHIVKSTNAGFGIAAYKNGKGIAERLGGISWQYTRRNCANHADTLLANYGDK